MFVQSIKNISEEDYNKLLQYSKDNNQAEITDFITEVANKSPFPPCGYGFCSPYFFEENGKYFVSWRHWNSCD